MTPKDIPDEWKVLARKLLASDHLWGGDLEALRDLAENKDERGWFGDLYAPDATTLAKLLVAILEPT